VKQIEKKKIIINRKYKFNFSSKKKKKKKKNKKKKKKIIKKKKINLSLLKKKKKKKDNSEVSEVYRCIEYLVLNKCKYFIILNDKKKKFKIWKFT